ncbi:MAG TPA: M50 family metallopeptidase [Solirubrobacteraceae bacterium]|nr:M50 family metallopeptidase [Solirubrobacteraceae bacterium]
MSWVLAILGILILIVLHELGHFIAAKAVGMRVERFSLFFPPKLIGIKRGETEYSIGAIPAGGYVKITGMSPIELTQLDLRVADRAYYMQQPWKRIVVILAGPAMNLLITFVLFAAVLLSGSLQGALLLGELDQSTATTVDTSRVAAIERGRPAQGALQVEDRIVGVEGRAASPEAVREAIAAARCAGQLRDGCVATRAVRLTVIRQGVETILHVRPRYSEKDGRMLIGFGFEAKAKDFGPVAAAGAALSEMWHSTTGTFKGLGRAFIEPKVRKQVSSIVGITRDENTVISQGTARALVFLGFISLVLAVMNLLPFLPLDGGHLLWSVLEKLRGRRVSLAAMYRYSSVGILLLLFLVINGIGNDIGRA